MILSGVLMTLAQLCVLSRQKKRVVKEKEEKKVLYHCFIKIVWNVSLQYNDFVLIWQRQVFNHRARLALLTVTEQCHFGMKIVCVRECVATTHTQSKKREFLT